MVTPPVLLSRVIGGDSEAHTRASADCQSAHRPLLPLPVKGFNCVHCRNCSALACDDNVIWRMARRVCQRDLLQATKASVSTSVQSSSHRQPWVGTKSVPLTGRASYPSWWPSAWTGIEWGSPSATRTETGPYSRLQAPSAASKFPFQRRSETRSAAYFPACGEAEKEKRDGRPIFFSFGGGA